eukprot:4430197-Amphidinium_carterae.2
MSLYRTPIPDDHPMLNWCVEFADQIMSRSYRCCGVQSLSTMPCDYGLETQGQSGTQSNPKHLCRDLRENGHAAYYEGRTVAPEVNLD